MKKRSQCLAKAQEMLDAASECPDDLVLVYGRLAADWYLLARQADWLEQFEKDSRNPSTGRTISRLSTKLVAV